MDSSSFSEYLIACSSFLDNLDHRIHCPKCQKSRKYFCYICNLPVVGQDQIPKLKLPLKIDIIKHEKEFHGKSTSCHAAILAPDDVTIYRYPVIPEYNCNTTLLLYPSSSAKTISDWLRDDRQSANQKEADPSLQPVILTTGKRNGDHISNGNVDAKVKSARLLCPFERIVLIDSTWNQSSVIFSDERLQHLKCLLLRDHTTKFWRYQRDNPASFLSTIEAIYFTLVEHFNATCGSTMTYDGRFDNLLFYFKFLYDKLYAMYDGGDDLKAYKKKNFQIVQ